MRDGQVRLDGESTIPDGTPVDIRPAASESLLDLIRRHTIRDPSLPKDFAAELDHYLYGLPKRTKKRKAKTAKSKSATRAKRPRGKSRRST
jgi:hypothetical protein